MESFLYERGSDEARESPPRYFHNTITPDGLNSRKMRSYWRESRGGLPG